MPTARVGPWSFAAAGVMMFLAETLQPTISGAVSAGGVAGWLAILLAGALAFLSYWLVVRCLARQGHAGLIGLAQAAAGKPGAILVALLFSVALLVEGGLVLREISEMTVSAIFPHTPQTFAMTGLFACALYGAMANLDQLIRLARFFLPILIFAIVLILAGTFPSGRLAYATPLWGPAPIPLVLRSAWLSGIAGPTLLYLWIGAGLVREKKQLALSGGVALGVGALFLAAVVLVLVMVEPVPLAQSVSFPLHTMARLVVGGRFFERIDALWLFVGTFATGLFLAVLLSMTAHIYSQAFAISQHSRVVPPLGAVLITIALFPPDQATAFAWHTATIPLAGIAVLLLPPLLALAAALRKGLSRHGP